ncbi:MAG: dihydrofolate reductase family protein [Acidimicrobiales bacterium]|nr:dihydrofolate reductase family protein [Acidimicrobiales bacterium]MCB9394576.1 dihydrofolate reductase family protein [Acidimicrobiaceae bacterium]
MADIIAGMRRLLPDPVDPLTVAEAYGVHRPRPTHRPWVGVCMVAGLDGSTVVDDSSRALSSPTDTEVLIGLRALADVIVVGASTVRIEGYGPPSKAGQTIGVVTRTGEGLDFTAPLFTSGAGFVVCPTSAPELPVPTVRAGRHEVDLAAALAQLDVGFVQAEGGSMLNGALATADLVDELNLTISPVISGGDGPRLTAGAPSLLRRMDLAHVCEDDGFLFTRYVRRSG